MNDAIKKRRGRQVNQPRGRRDDTGKTILLVNVVVAPTEIPTDFAKIYRCRRKRRARKRVVRIGVGVPVVANVNVKTSVGEA